MDQPDALQRAGHALWRAGLLFGGQAAAVIVHRLSVIALRVVDVGDVVHRIAYALFVSRRFELARGFGVEADRGLVITLLVLGLRNLEQAAGVGRRRFDPFQTPLVKFRSERVIALVIIDIADVFERLRDVVLLVQLFVNGESSSKVFDRRLRLAEGGLRKADVGKKVRPLRFPAKFFLDRQAFLIGVERLPIELLREIDDAGVHQGLREFISLAEFLRDQTLAEQDRERARIIGLRERLVTLTYKQPQQFAVDQLLLSRQQRLAFGVVLCGGQRVG